MGLYRDIRTCILAYVDSQEEVADLHRLQLALVGFCQPVLDAARVGDEAPERLLAAAEGLIHEYGAGYRSDAELSEGLARIAAQPESSNLILDVGKWVP
jgi:hypothetical protein